MDCLNYLKYRIVLLSHLSVSFFMFAMGKGGEGGVEALTSSLCMQC